MLSNKPKDRFKAGFFKAKYIDLDNALLHTKDGAPVMMSIKNFLSSPDANPSSAAIFLHTAAMLCANALLLCVAAVGLSAPAPGLTLLLLATLFMTAITLTLSTVSLLMGGVTLLNYANSIMANAHEPLMPKINY